jgi:hypothetical protein
VTDENGEDRAVTKKMLKTASEELRTECDINETDGD